MTNRTQKMKYDSKTNYLTCIFQVGACRHHEAAVKALTHPCDVISAAPQTGSKYTAVRLAAVRAPADSAHRVELVQ